MGNKELSRDLIIDWDKFKSKAKSSNLERAKNGYIEFCKMLHEVDFELVSNYVSSGEKVELKYRLNNYVSLNTTPNVFKTYIHKAIINFKNNLEEDKDEFIEFIGLTAGGNLIASIKTYDGGIIGIDISRYKSFIEGRQDFYDKLEEIGGSTNEFYKNDKDKISISIDNIKLNMSPNNFKYATYKRIIKIKQQLKTNDDKLIKFVSLTNKNNLISQIKAFDGGVVELDMGTYNSFNKGRKDFYDKLKEVNGYTTDCYKGNRIKMNIFIDDVELNSMNPDNFKRGTYKAIIDFKNKLIKNGDEFIKFTGLTNGGKLIAKIKTLDRGLVEIDIANYNRWNKSRQEIYNYCKSKKYKIFSPYIKDGEKMFIDFNCGHKPHWTTSTTLKQDVSCPICNISKGEKFIKIYLEKNNVDFIQEYRFNDCKYKNPYRLIFIYLL